MVDSGECLIVVWDRIVVTVVSVQAVTQVHQRPQTVNHVDNDSRMFEVALGLGAEQIRCDDCQTRMTEDGPIAVIMFVVRQG